MASVFDATAFSDRDGRSGHFGLFSIEEGMTDMGGRLEIESSLGKGCRAVLRLPIADKGSRAA